MIASITFDDISPRLLGTSRLRRIVEFIDGLGLTCTMFAVPKDFESCPPADFMAVLEKAVRSGHELAMHGAGHGRNEFGILHPVPLPIPYPTFRMQIQRLGDAKNAFRNALGLDPVGFRAPHYISNGNTLKALAELGFLYDSSAIVFKPAHLSNLRIRWFGHRPRISRGTLRIPVTGDYVYRLRKFGFSRSMDSAVRDFEAGTAESAVFVVNNHPQLFQDEEFLFLQTLVERLQGRTTYLTLKDVAGQLKAKRRQEAPEP